MPVTEIPAWVIYLIAFAQLIFAVSVALIAVCGISLCKATVNLVKETQGAIQDTRKEFPTLARETHGAVKDVREQIPSLAGVLEQKLAEMDPPKGERI